MNFIDYVKGAFKELPAHRWSGTSATGTLEVTEHSAGMDLARGPWVKFKFREGNKECELQGYKTWQGTDRIKFGPVGAMAEVDDDRLSFTAAADLPDAKLLVIVKFTFEQNDKLYAYRFVGKTN